MGELYTRKRGKKWEYRFEVAPIDGKRKQESKGGFATQKEALKEGNKALSEYNNSGIVFTPSELSVSDYLDYWLKNYCEINLKAGTVTNYRKKINNHIRPALGHYKLKYLNSAVLQEFLNSMFNNGYSRNTLSVIKGILSGSLYYAVEPLKFIQESPMIYIKLPSPRAKAKTPTRKAPHVYIPPDKIEMIFNYFKKGTSTYIPLQFGYKAGMRIGEAFAVFWEDISFGEKTTLKINRQVNWDETLKMWYFSDPKYDSFRTIEIDSELAKYLKEEKERQEKSKEYYGEHYTLLYENEKRQINDKGDGQKIHLIAVRENGEFITPRSMQHTSSVIHHKLNYPEFTFHSLRHTHATMLAEAGAFPKYVQERLGHKNGEVTARIYQHLTDKMADQGYSKLEEMYK